MSHRIYIAEIWHNPDHDFLRIVRNLTGRLRGNKDTTDEPSNWAWIAIRVAVMFALFGELCKIHVADSHSPIDVALPSGDFAGPMAVWYARQMGLPVANIICACDENDAAWDLLRNGEISFSSAVTVPQDLERLIYSAVGLEETLSFANRMESKKSFKLSPEDGEAVKQGMYPAVISWKRRSEIIHGVYSASTYILDPGSAMAFGGLQDYRALAGETRPALILTERGPIRSADTVASAMGISVEMLKQRLNIN
jgi:threonine synthase